MPVVRLTNKRVAQFSAPDPSGKQTLHWDSELRGLGVLCSGTTNGKVYVAQRNLPDGRTRRVTIGSVNEITLDVARSRAADTLDSIRRGVDPKSRIETPTLRQALEDYLTARKDLRPATVRTYRTVGELYLRPWLDLKINTVTSVMVQERHAAIPKEIAGKKGTSAANLSMRVFRAVYNFAADRVPELPPCPVKLKRQWYEEPRRERMVRSEELEKFYSAVINLDSPVHRDLILLLLFTGMRSSEAKTLTWEDIDLPMRIIRVSASRTKAKRKFDLPMSDFVHDLLVARRALGDAKYVFPGRSTHVTNTKKAFTSIMVPQASRSHRTTCAARFAPWPTRLKSALSRSSCS